MEPLRTDEEIQRALDEYQVASDDEEVADLTAMDGSASATGELRPKESIVELESDESDSGGEGPSGTQHTATGPKPDPKPKGKIPVHQSKGERGEGTRKDRTEH